MIRCDRASCRTFFPLLILLLSGCGSTSVTFVNVTPEQVAEAIVGEGDTATEYQLFMINDKRIWPEDFHRTILGETGSATWKLHHFLAWDEGTDAIRVQPQTPDRCLVEFRSGIKRNTLINCLLPNFFYSRNVERERRIILRAWWRLLRKDPSVYAVGTGGWQPPKPPEFTFRDGVWLAFNGGDVKTAAGVFVEEEFECTCRGRDRWQLQRRRGEYRDEYAPISSLEGAIVKRCGDTVVVGFAFEGWQLLRTGCLTIDLLTTCKPFNLGLPLSNDYGRLYLQKIAESLAVRFDSLQFISAEPHIELIKLPPKETPGGER